MTFRIPKINSCCCFTLATGSKIIGCLELLVIFLGTIVMSLLYVTPLSLAIYFLQRAIYDSMFLNIGVYAFIMVYGAFKRDHILLFPWILIQSIETVFLLFSLVAQIAYMGLMDTRFRTMEIEFFFAIILSLAVLVVYNFYRDLRDSRPSELM